MGTWGSEFVTGAATETAAAFLDDTVEAGFCARLDDSQEAAILAHEVVLTSKLMP